jgi:hypothetical protein
MAKASTRLISSCTPLLLIKKTQIEAYEFLLLDYSKHHRRRAMDLIERYLHEVGHQLPVKNRKEILDKLDNSINDALKSSGGDVNNEDNVCAVLKEIGPPEKVAATYFPEGQYLIGPSLFPVFKTTIGIALLVILIVFAVLFSVMVLIAGDIQGGLNLISGIFGTAMSTLGVIVVVFYVLQQLGIKPEKTKEDWDPRTLPAVTDNQLIKRGEVILDIAFSTVLMVILLSTQASISIITTPGGKVTIVTDPVLVQYLPWIVATILIGIGVDAVLLWKGRWTIGTRLLKIGTNLVDLLVLSFLLLGHDAWLRPYIGDSIFTIFNYLPGVGASGSNSIQVIAMQSIQIALVVVTIVITIETITLIFRFFKHLLIGE